MRVLWPGFPCLDSLRGPLGFEAACAGSLSNCTTIFLSYKRHEYVLHALPFETHKPKLQTRYTDIHTEATCSSVAFTKFALLSPQVFPFVPDRNNIYGECLCMRASASTFEFDIVHISLPGLASSLVFLHAQGWQAHCKVMAHVISKKGYSAGTGWQARVIKYTDVIYTKHNT
jgi:hypothetical protein